MLLVAHAQLGDESADRIEDRVERVAVAGQDHPRGQGARAFPVERVEGAVDDLAHVPFAGARAFDRLGDAAGDAIGDRSGELRLKPGGGSEMVEQVGVRAADLGSDRLQGHRLRTLLEQQLPRGLQRGGAAFLRVQAFTAY